MNFVASSKHSEKIICTPSNLNKVILIGLNESSHQELFNQSLFQFLMTYALFISQFIQFEDKNISPYCSRAQQVPGVLISKIHFFLVYSTGYSLSFFQSHAQWQESTHVNSFLTHQWQESETSLYVNS